MIAPLVFTVVVAFAMALSPVWDYDVWFQLACGRAIAALKSLPAHDLFSYTAADRPWDTQEWLAQVVFYAVHAATGLGGLTVFKALVSASVFAVVFRHAMDRMHGGVHGPESMVQGSTPPATRDSGRGTPDPAAAWFTAAGCAVAAYVMRWHLVERPQIFTMLFLAAELSLLHRGRRLGLLIPLAVLWANVHGGSSLLAPGVLILWIAGRGLALWTRREPLAGLRPAGMVCLGLLLAVMANPAGPKIYLYPFETMSDRMYMMNVREWTPPTPAEHPAFYLFLVGTAALLAFSARRLAAPELIIAAVFAGLSLSARRHIPLFCLAVIPPAAAALSGLASAVIRSPRARAVAAVALGIAAAAGTLGTAARHGEAARMGVRERLYPAAGIRALLALPRSPGGGNPVRVFGLHQWGGYLLWRLPPEFKVFIDGRQLVYGRDLFLDYYRILENTPDAGALLERYRPDVFVLDYHYSAKLSRRLVSRREAALVHWDDACLVFVARSARFAEFIRRHEYASCHPLAESSPDLEASLADLDRAAREAPGDARPLAMRASLLLRHRRLDEAAAAAARALDLNAAGLPVLLTALEISLARNDPEGARPLLARAARADEAGTASKLAEARLRLAEGQPAAAARALDEAIKAGEAWRGRRKRPEPVLADAYAMKAARLFAAGRPAEAADALRLAGNVLYELGRLSEAEARYREGTEAAPSDMRLWHNLGTVLLEQERFSPALRMFRKALVLAPGNPDALIGLGVALHRLGRTPEAAAAWEEALRAAPGHPDATQYLQAVQSTRYKVQR